MFSTNTLSNDKKPSHYGLLIDKVKLEQDVLQGLTS